MEAEAAAAAAAAEKIREKEARKAKKELEKAQKIMEREEQKAAKQALRLAQKEVCTVRALLSRESLVFMPDLWFCLALVHAHEQPRIYKLMPRADCVSRRSLAATHEGEGTSKDAEDNCTEKRRDGSPCGRGGEHRGC